jgi:lysozyme
VTDAIIDLSHFNLNPDFTTTKTAGIQAVIHKATQGATFVDPAYLSHHQSASAAGLRWGAYHFGDASDAVAQADFFLEILGPAPPSVIALDLEQQMTLAQTHTFVTRIHSATGRWPVLYGGDYLKRLLGGTKDPVLANCCLWLADYSENATVAANWQTWTMWQYTGSATVPGIGQCDRSRFNGSPVALEKFFTQ